MPESSIVVRPESMDDTYTASTRLQATGLAPAIAVFERAAADVPLPAPTQPMVIADYGAGTGYNSLLPIGAAIEVLRKRTTPEHSVLVAHTDTVDNDFSVLFRTVEEDPDTYLRKDAATFASAVGRSFYSQILPSNSVHLGWSSWAVQWLSKVPAPIDGHFHISGCTDDAVRAAFDQQAARDWHEFIAYRGRELCPGGRLVVMTLGIGEDGDMGFGPLLAAIMDALTEVAGSGLVTAEEVAGMCVPTVARRAVDFTAPFAPSGRFERLEIEHLEVFDSEDRFWVRYQVDGNAEDFGARWAAFARASVFPALAAGLAGGAADPRTPQLLDRLEAGTAARLAAAPERTPIPLAHVVLIKRPRT
ncbi:class I SAM-dependent methyltransferase [Mycobacterium sp. Y57]|uniref:class I SAM-dependent methyltransferase n=1 Tax=Mycolicibacterium xanthum TaxID=2796469 RepID=UPI001C86147C|nr:class I SAM-dependent methyltransferase [Mycolicibacterium xanthum]MBX7431562.1 class I SAM-dependent methyltransferase [Mycolicibacterium xanthum]